MLQHPTVPSQVRRPSRHLHLTVHVLTGAIRLGGELDRSSAYHLADAVSALRSSPAPVWTLDLQDVSFCDVEGLRVLHRARELARLSGRGLHLTRVRPVLADLLALFGWCVESVVQPMPLRAPATAAS